MFQINNKGKISFKCLKKIWKVFLQKFKTIFSWFMPEQKNLKNINLKQKIARRLKEMDTLVKRKLKIQNLYKT